MGQHANSLRAPAKADLAFDQPVRQRSSAKHAEQRSEGQMYGAAESGHRQVQMEFAIEKTRHPCKEDDGDKVRPHKDRDQQQRLAVSEDVLQQADDGLPARVPGHNEVVRHAARRLAQHAPEDTAEHDSQCAKENKRGTPVSGALTRQTGERSTGDAADVDAGLMDRHRAGAGVDGVIVADQRHGSRKVEGLAQPAKSTKEDEFRVVSRECGAGRGQRPEDKPAKHQHPARQPVAK